MKILFQGASEQMLATLPEEWKQVVFNLKILKIKKIFGKFEAIGHEQFSKIYNNFVLLFVRFDMGMCGGPVFSVSASRSPVPGSILGPGPPPITGWSEGRQMAL